MYCFFFNDTATTEIYTLSLHDALPICPMGLILPARPLCAPGRISSRTRLAGEGATIHRGVPAGRSPAGLQQSCQRSRSEEHTSELQSPCNLVCRLLLEKKKN